VERSILRRNPPGGQFQRRFALEPLGHALGQKLMNRNATTLDDPLNLHGILV
jgi:hypothetical protein